MVTMVMVLVRANSLAQPAVVDTAATALAAAVSCQHWEIHLPAAVTAAAVVAVGMM